jgi:GAF domain-containing protein
MSDEQERAITLAGARLDRHRSICAFFHSQDREDQVLCPPDEFLKELSRRTVRLSNLARLIVPDLADWCTVTLFEPDWSVYHMVVAHVDQAKVDLAYDLQRRYPPRQEELANEARPWQRGQSELYPEITEAMLAADARDAEHYQILRDLNLRSAMAVPLAARGRVLGLMLFVWAESGHRYDEQDLALAEELARRAAITLDNARLYEAEQLARQVAEKTTQRIAALQTITAALSIALTPAEVSDVILQKSVSVLQAGGGAVMLLSEDGESLEIFRATGYSEAGLKPFQRFPLAASIPASEAVRSGKAVWITSHHDFEARYSHLAFARPAESRTEGVAVVPMLLEGRALGALAVSFEKVRAFSADDKDFLETLASLCAQALDRAHLYEAERKARTEAEAAQHSLALLAEVRERNRLAQELHDNVAQTVAYLNLKIASLPQLFASNQPEKIRSELSELKQVVGAAYTDIRGEIFNLRAGPAGDQIRISIEDQGQGFDPTQEKASSFGLKIMRERIESIGGCLEIESRPGQGRQVTLLYSPESGK